MPEDKVNLLNLDRAGLEAFFAERGEKPFRATQILKWIYQCGVDDFGEMTNLSKALRERLGEVAEVRAPEIVSEHVFIPEDDRGTLCVSSQVGCALECSFCATARQGFNRNLTTAEIIGQLWAANRAMRVLPREERVITNVVLMGMGEPLLNFDNVVRAMNLMMEDHAYGLSKRRITLSTSGVIPALDRLREVSDVSLAVSLHAPDDELRNELVPLNRKYPIADLLAACRRYLGGEGSRRVTFEYVMLDGVNDSPEHARRLVKLMRQVPSKVNLIPFNPFTGSGYRTSPPERVEAFRQILMQAGPCYS